jgi:hypothetical protein
VRHPFGARAWGGGKGWASSSPGLLSMRRAQKAKKKASAVDNTDAVVDGPVSPEKVGETREKVALRRRDSNGPEQRAIAEP